MPEQQDTEDESRDPTVGEARAVAGCETPNRVELSPNQLDRLERVMPHVRTRTGSLAEAWNRIRGTNLESLIRSGDGLDQYLARMDYYDARQERTFWGLI